MDADIITLYMDLCTMKTVKNPQHVRYNMRDVHVRLGECIKTATRKLSPSLFSVRYDSKQIRSLNVSKQTKFRELYFEVS